MPRAMPPPHQLAPQPMTYLMSMAGPLAPLAGPALRDREPGAGARPVGIERPDPTGTDGFTRTEERIDPPGRDPSARGGGNVRHGAQPRRPRVPPLVPPAKIFKWRLVLFSLFYIRKVKLF